jgi:hypothetical protein
MERAIKLHFYSEWAIAASRRPAGATRSGTELQSGIKAMILLGNIWCCRRGLNSRPLPYQQQGKGPDGTPWCNALHRMVFSHPDPVSTGTFRRVSPEPKITAPPVLPRAPARLETVRQC